MRGHKFIILVGDTDMAFSNFAQDDNLESQIVEFTCEEYIKVVTLPHEKFSDNVVEIVNPDPAYEDAVSVVRDVEGKLWYFTDYKSKADLIREFEQTD